MGIGFDRACSVYSDAVGEALRLLPPGVEARVRGTRFLIGVDPVYVGVHFNDWSAYFQASYRDTPHCCWEINLAHRPASDRAPIVVFPNPEVQAKLLGARSVVATVVHELAHVLDERLGFRTPWPYPVCESAAIDGYEAFAYAFEAWLLPDIVRTLTPWNYDLDVLAADAATLAFFESL